ncbi:hypothetical protein CH063_13635, partial [Colletotrichum higginsianum]
VSSIQLPTAADTPWRGYWRPAPQVTVLYEVSDDPCPNGGPQPLCPANRHRLAFASSPSKYNPYRPRTRGPHPLSPERADDRYAHERTNGKPQDKLNPNAGNPCVQCVQVSERACSRSTRSCGHREAQPSSCFSGNAGWRQNKIKRAILVALPEWSGAVFSCQRPR